MPHICTYSLNSSTMLTSPRDIQERQRRLNKVASRVKTTVEILTFVFRLIDTDLRCLNNKYWLNKE